MCAVEALGLFQKTISISSLLLKQNLKRLSSIFSICTFALRACFCYNIQYCELSEALNGQDLAQEDVMSFEDHLLLAWLEAEGSQ